MSRTEYLCPRCLTRHSKFLEDETYTGETFIYSSEDCEECGRENNVTITITVEIE